jgi:hypothetical protein
MLCSAKILKVSAVPLEVSGGVNHGDGSLLGLVPIHGEGVGGKDRRNKTRRGQPLLERMAAPDSRK